MSVSIPELVVKAREDLSSLTGLELGTTVATLKNEKGWQIQVELVEKKSLPDSMDILATYEVQLDDEGTLLEFKRGAMRKRLETVNPERE